MKKTLFAISLISLSICYACSNKSEAEKKLEKIEKEAEKGSKKLKKALED